MEKQNGASTKKNQKQKGKKTDAEKTTATTTEVESRVSPLFPVLTLSCPSPYQKIAYLGKKLLSLIPNLPVVQKFYPQPRYFCPPHPTKFCPWFPVPCTKYSALSLMALNQLSKWDINTMPPVPIPYPEFIPQMRHFHENSSWVTKLSIFFHSQLRQVCWQLRRFNNNC